MPTDFVTILTGDKCSAKRVFWRDGHVVVEASRLSYYHRVAYVAVDGIGDLHKVIAENQHKLNGYVIRGRLREGQSPDQVRRTVRSTEDNPAAFEEVARHWVMVDIDDLLMPTSVSSVDADAGAIVAYAISALPAEFHSCFCIYQWSGSMGFKLDKVRLHLWFWLDRPVSDAEMKVWLRGCPVDLSLYNPVQPHFTANPIIEDGIEDPIRGRVGLYAPDGFSETVKVPADLSARSVSASVVRRHRGTSGSIDPQAIVRDPITGLVVDGRELFLHLKSNDATKELLQERSGEDKKRGDALPSIEQIAHRTWDLFRAEADLSDGKWTKEDAWSKAERRHGELESGAYSFVSRADTTVLEPVGRPFVDLDLVTKQEAEARLDKAFGKFFDKIDEAPRTALRITMGAGKTRGAIRHLQQWLSSQYGKRVEIYVPRHDLADQYMADIRALDGGIRAKVIHVYPRTGGAMRDLPVLCQRADYVRCLEDAGIGVFQSACRSNAGDHCVHFDECPYITQFSDPEIWEDNQGNTIRISVHSHLGLPRNPIQNDADLVIIDEAFLIELIEASEKISPSDIKRNMVTQRHPKLGRAIINALEDGEPLLKTLRDQGVTVVDLADIDLEHLRPDVGFSPDEKRAMTTGGNAGLYRKLTTMVQLLREELSFIPERDHTERIVFDPQAGSVRRSYIKDIQIPETAALLLLDATADEMLLEQLIGPVQVERIDVKQRAVVTQVFDRIGSKKFWDGETAPISELIAVANAWAEFGEKPLIVSHKALSDRLQSDDRLRRDVKLMHFAALRGSNAAKDCSVIFITGRNMPPLPEIDLKARALFWDADEPLADFGNTGQRFH